MDQYPFSLTDFLFVKEILYPQPESPEMEADKEEQDIYEEAEELQRQRQLDDDDELFGYGHSNVNPEVRSLAENSEIQLRLPLFETIRKLLLLLLLMMMICLFVCFQKVFNLVIHSFLRCIHTQT